jgi:hypothetical protein
MENLVKVSALAGKLGYHPHSLRRLIREGRFDGAVVRIGRSIRLREEVVNQWVKANSKSSEQEGA